MGAAGSSNSVRHSPAYGVPVNPRLEYANRKSALQGGENILLDAPSLVKLQHGTVRYRYIGEESGKNQRTNNKNNHTSQTLDTAHRVEKPHEGEDRHKKHGYFYHSKLNDFSDAADPSQEEAWKFCYVYKGATRAKQKQLYYVFGKGLQTNDKGFVQPKYISDVDSSQDTTSNSHSTSKKPGRASNNVKNDDSQESKTFYKYHGHMYYDVEYVFTDEGNLEENQLLDEVQILGDGQIKTDDNEVIVIVNDSDTVQRIKRKMAVKMFKPATHFHLFLYGEEVAKDEKAAVFRPRAEKVKRFKILLKPMSSVQHNQ